MSLGSIFHPGFLPNFCLRAGVEKTPLYSRYSRLPSSGEGGPRLSPAGTVIVGAVHGEDRELVRSPPYGCRLSPAILGRRKCVDVRSTGEKKLQQ
jgi:hypothetical protein